MRFHNVACRTLMCSLSLCAQFAVGHKNVLLQSLSLREKIGQLLMVPITTHPATAESLATQALVPTSSADMSVIDQLITEYKVGGVILLGKNGLADAITLIRHCQDISYVPLLVGCDAEWGLSLRIPEAIRFPRALTLGATQDARLVYEIGKEIARQCRLVGIHWNFAPVVDVNNNPNNPVIHDRSFGKDPQMVATLATASMQGLHDGGMLACAKHFPGHGDTAEDSHWQLPIIQHAADRLHAIELYPFQELIHAGVDSVMTAHLLVTAFDQMRPASVSPSIVTNLLQKELGFTGLIVTDALNMRAVCPPNVNAGELAVQAFCAGSDVLLCPTDVPAAINALAQAVTDGRITVTELDRRVEKVLRAKEQGEVCCQMQRDVAAIIQDLYTDHARQLKRRAYTQAITIEHDPEHTVPLAADKYHMLVQIGGAADVTFSSVLANALQTKVYQVSSAMTLPTESFLLHKLKDAEDVVIALCDVQKYAAKKFGISDQTLHLLHVLREMHKPTIVVVFGTPYSKDLLQEATAVVLAYENDSDAQQAAADVLLGKSQASGKIPI